MECRYHIIEGCYDIAIENDKHMHMYFKRVKFKTYFGATEYFHLCYLIVNINTPNKQCVI